MRDIPEALVNRYTATLDGLQRAAAAHVDAGVRSYMDAHPDADVARCREAAKALMADAVSAYGDAAASAAADLAEAVWGDRSEVDWPRWEEVEAEASRIAHYQAGKLVDGDREGFVSQLASSAADRVLLRANSSVPTAVAKRGKKTRYARMLRGPEPCGWCFMLATRGFDFTSAEAASHAHRGCRCVVVPGEKDGSIGNYDLKGMRDRYDSVVLALPHKSTDGEIVAALELRDPGWLFDGHVSGFDIPTAKLTRYALCRTNRNGGADKARAFKKYLGYGSDDWMEVASKVYAHVSGNDPTHTFSDEYGERFQSDFVMDGKDGRKARVRVGWIKRPDDTGLQLVSIMVKEK